MKKSKVLFFTTITLFGLMFAVFAVMAESVTTPSFEVSETPSGGPVVVGEVTLSTAQVDQNETVTFTAQVEDVSGVDVVAARIVNSDGITISQVSMNETTPGIYSIAWNIGTKQNGTYNLDIVMTDNLGNTNIARSSSTLTIVGGADNTCTADTDCTESNTKCCSNVCSYDACQINTDCVRCINDEIDIDTGDCVLGTESGTCNTSTCPNSCDYTATPPTTCAVDSDCGPTLYDACCGGVCMTHACDTVSDCTAQPYGACDISVCPHACTYNAPDTTPPSVAITEPLDVASDPSQPFTTDTIVVKVTATDTESNIDRVEYHVDGAWMGQQIVDQTAYGNPNEYWQTMSIANGTHVLTATAYDGELNTSQASINIEFNLANNAPIIDSFSTDKSSYVSTEAVQVYLTAHDSDSNITSILLFSSKGGGAIYSNTYTQPSLSLTAGIGASTIVDWGNAFDKYAVRQDNFKLPFIKVANAEIIGNQNCTTSTNNYNRYIYAMVADATNPATQSNNVNLVISVTATTCVPVNSSSSSSSSSEL